MKFDVLVVGAGPAGLNAAKVAAEAGVSVGVVDDNVLPGGQIWRQGPRYALRGPARWVLDALAQRPNITYLGGTRIVQTLTTHELLAQDARRGFRIGYAKLILATGSRERFLPYPGWTLPGVTGAGGLQALVKGGMPVKGERIVIAGTGPLLWAAALTAHEQGARILAIIEQAPSRRVSRFVLDLLAYTPAKLLQATYLRAALRATPYWRGAHVIEACGDTRLTGVRVRRSSGTTVRITCDRLACAYGLIPETSIGTALGCCPADETSGAALAVDTWQATSVADIYAAGECTGVGGVDLAAVEGRIASYAALGACAKARALFATRERQRRFAARMNAAFALDPQLKTLATSDTVLCRCEDVSFGAVARHRSWRDAKLHTRCGMGPCQGKICGTAAAFCLDWPIDGPRPPLTPARIGTLLQADGRNI
ncbi:MAG: NAD(P)/FAD-dependent oxidoreductase [Burkholderiaceae bacterium]|jgi:NADPH-dependent 2,4-dienoyl-CoA reductase/sulfur reductase-like enzyme|nr:NAD(P)/FAD-dependent oxidoreductase [Burkholderiaceae bacterium]